MNLKRIDVFNFWIDKNGNHKDKNLQVCREILNMMNIKSPKFEESTKRKINEICDQLSKRWKKSNRTKSRFLKQNTKWLNSTVLLFPQMDNMQTPTNSLGRPEKSFSSSSERTRRRKIKELATSCEQNQLIGATKLSLKIDGKRDEVKLLKESLETSPTRASKIISNWNIQKSKPIIPYTSEEALSLIIETKLSKSDYLTIRREGKERNFDVYPSYKKMLQAKLCCYPSPDNILVTELSAKIKLQGLLDHTVFRIILSQSEVFENTYGPLDLILITKWGCDGSTGHSEYKQFIETENASDSNIFLTSLVPLQLFSYSKIDPTQKIIYWQNPRPSSTRYCRPLHFYFQKETTAFTLQEAASVKKEIDELKPTEMNHNGQLLSIKHQMKMTMIDGKICSVMTETSSSQACNICEATPKIMNNIQNVKTRPINNEALDYGLSTLHAWIRFMEYFLHVAYRLDIKKWQARSQEEKDSVKERKKNIQLKFRTEMGLIIDKVKAGGSGTSNDGNTSRRFFADPLATSKILELNEECIRRCSCILQVMSSGFAINESKFQEYAEETANLLVNKYPFYYMPSSVHKVLIHGASIISAAILPIGMLSEEAQESRNKDLKHYREHFSRKRSRIDTNQDLLNRFLISSDPFISGLRSLPKKNKQIFFSEALHLLKDDSSSLAKSESSDSEEE